MKITADNWSLRFATCPVILLNGDALDHVVEADDIEGYAIVCMTRDGKFMIDEAGDCFATKRLTGKIEFIGGDPR